MKKLKILEDLQAICLYCIKIWLGIILISLVMLAIKGSIFWVSNLRFSVVVTMFFLIWVAILDTLIKIQKS